MVDRNDDVIKRQQFATRSSAQLQNGTELFYIAYKGALC